MTSVYRQIGIGCEKLFRTILRDSLGLATEDVISSYKLPLANGKARTLSLDGEVGFTNVECKAIRRRNSKKELIESDVTAVWP